MESRASLVFDDVQPVFLYIPFLKISQSGLLVRFSAIEA